MSNNTWEADKMLDVYIHDYLLKRNFHATAKTFMAEGKVSADPVAIDAPGGFLFEWWSVFWDIFIARTNEKHSEVAAAYTETQHIMAKDQQQMQQLQYLQQKQIQQLQQRRELNTSLSGTPNVMNADNMLGQSTANALVTKMYEERLKNPHQREGDLPTQMLDPNRVALLKAASNPSGVLLQSNGHGMNTAFPQVQGRSQQLGVNVLDIKNEVNVALNQRTVTDPSVFGVPGALHSKQNLLNSGINQGAGALSVKGWPLTGIEQFRSNLGPQSHKSFMPSSQQFLQHHNLPEQQRQQILMQSQQNNGNLASPGSTFPGEMDPQRFRASMIAGMGVKDGSLTGNNCSQQGGSTLQATPSMQRASPLDQADTMKMVQMQQQSSVQLQTQQQHEQQQLQHMGTNQNQHDNMTCVLGVGSDSNNMPSVQTNDQIHNNKKRKQSSSSGIANSLGAGNNSLNSAPSPPSTHTPGDGLSTASNLNHNTNMSKNIIMYGSDGTGGLAPNSNQVVDIGPFTENGAMGENIDSYLSHGDGEPRDGLFGTVRHASVEHSTKASNSFSFREFARLHESSNKIICCHFSSDGHFLAGAGLESKTFIWNVDSLQKDSTLGEHSSPITDVRFSPNSTQLATSSVDKTVRLWDAENPSNSSCTFSGHTANVMSLDFHSQNEDLLCSCDSSSEIRYWSVSQRGNTRCFKGGTVQVRFQPSGGQYLAAAADTVVSIFDIESTSSIHSFKRHTKPVHSLCWDVTGSLLASVSEDSVRVWSLSSGDCVHELNCNGNKFHSCVFHPTYSSLLVIGCYQSLELWNMADNKCMTVPAHEGLIAALAVSPVRGLVASASHDRSIKLWK